MTQSDQSVSVIPELQRLSRCVELLDELRVVFAQMDAGGERDRAWAYLSDRFAEFERSDMPGWENLDPDTVPLGTAEEVRG